MNVYTIQANGTYGGGMAIVAAETQESAIRVCCEQIKDDNWNVRYYKPEKVEILPVKYDGPEMVLCHYETGE